jgi:hypothetical protein
VRRTCRAKRGTVHGRAVRTGVKDRSEHVLRQTLLDTSVPRDGAQWECFLDAGPGYARIDAERMFTFHLSEAVES